ncbi:MAG: hypothetical protein LBE22_12395 [Azoarcus sp.]|jgi:uncharacterized protein YbjQ (UPF0145 family)|nr:hypothetical protein [Azoarcus sp.]
MKKFLWIPVAFLLSSCAGTPRDDAYFLSIQDVLESSEAQKNLIGDIRFYFAGQPHPDVEETLEQGHSIYKRARALRRDRTESIEKNDELGCNRSMLTILRIFQARARKAGGNAVINIENHYKESTFRSTDTFECHVGAGGARVILKGDIVKLK